MSPVPSVNNKTDYYDITQILLKVALNSYKPLKNLIHFKNHVKVLFSVWPIYFELFFQPDEKEQKEQKDFVELLTARVEGEDPEILVEKEQREEGNTLLPFL